MKDLLHIFVPTWNNPEYLNPCVMSILRTGILNEHAKLFIVNNGEQPIKQQFGHIRGIEVLDTGKNLGWEGGLDYALKQSDAPYVCFQNDDTYIPTSSARIYQRMLMHFMNPNISAVGPSTTTSSGLQTIYHPNPPMAPIDVNWLIFFMVMLRRSDVDSVGGIDTSLPGGDDFDMSIRLKKLGKKLIIDPAAFLIHHGFKTGTRVFGDGYAGVKDGWNSPQMIERTQHALIRKHGFKTFVENYYCQKVDNFSHATAQQDVEGDIVRSFIQGDVVVELGCGGQKTIESAIGVDRVKKGEFIPNLSEVKSVADVVGDVQKNLPFEDLSADTVIARHILEHCLDSLEVLKTWNKILKIGGRLIIAVPDEDVTSGIPLNSEHCHAFTSKSLKSLAEASGFSEVESIKTGNGISFVSCFKKVAPSEREAVLV